MPPESHVVLRATLPMNRLLLHHDYSISETDGVQIENVHPFRVIRPDVGQ